MAEHFGATSKDVHSDLTVPGPSRPADLNPDTLRSLVVAALEAVAERAENQKRWRGECAEFCGVHVRTVEAWLYGEKTPGSIEMVALIVWLGAGGADLIAFIDRRQHAP